MAVTSRKNQAIDDLKIWYCLVNEIGTVDEDMLQRCKVSKIEKQKVLSFLFMDDKKRSLLSFILQKTKIKQTFHSNHNILRTKEGKPYLEQDMIDNGTWNFNVSHQGNYVSIASCSNFLIGIDIVDLKKRSGTGESLKEYLSYFSKQLTTFEYDNILSLKNEELSYKLFLIFWALKESYVKAIGTGVGFNFKQIEFHINLSEDTKFQLLNNDQMEGTAPAFVNNKEKTDWRFNFFSLDDNYLMAIARGPLHEATNSYLKTAFKSYTTEELKTFSTNSFFLELINKPVPKPIKKEIQEIISII